MISKGKFYSILFLVLLLCGIGILLMRSYYGNKHNPALMVNATWHNQSVRHDQEVYAKLNYKLRQRLLQVADETTKTHITELNNRTKSIRDVLLLVREQLLQITGGLNPNTGVPTGIEDRKICTDYLVKQGHGEKIKQQIDEYLDYLRSIEVDTFLLMPSPQELKDAPSHYYGLKEEWLVGNSYSEFMLQDLTLAQCLLHFDWVTKEISTLEMWALQNIEKSMLKKGILQGEAYL